MSSVNDEVVDEQRLAGSGRGLGQFLVARQHVDETGFADIGAANEGVLGAVVLGALADECATLEVGGVLDVHDVALG